LKSTVKPRNLIPRWQAGLRTCGIGIMPDLIFPLEDGVTHDSVCQIPPHQRTRQNPVNHQDWNLLWIIRLKKKYALPVLASFMKAIFTPWLIAEVSVNARWRSVA
jgi:hypothetical protein